MYVKQRRNSDDHRHFLDRILKCCEASRGPSATADLSVLVDCSDGELQRHHWRHDHQAGRQNLRT